MARKRTELGPEVDARIQAGAKKGETAERIALAIGNTVSVRTVGRRMRELRGPVAAPRSTGVASVQARPETPAAPASAPLPTTPDDIPPDASLAELHDLMARCKRQLTQAEIDDNGPLAGQMIRVAASLAETIRKATPPERADPNDAPDMVALGAEVVGRLLKAIDLVTEAPIEGWKTT